MRINKDFGFKRLVPPPLDAYKGRKFTVLGSWWPSTTEADKSKQFTLRALDVDMKQTAAPGTKDMKKIPISDRNLSDRKSLILGDYMKCMAAFGNGARMHFMKIIVVRLLMEVLG